MKSTVQPAQPCLHEGFKQLYLSKQNVVRLTGNKKSYLQCRRKVCIAIIILDRRYLFPNGITISNYALDVPTGYADYNGWSTMLGLHTRVCKIKHLKIHSHVLITSSWHLKIIWCWSNSRIPFNHISYTYYGMHRYTYYPQLDLIKHTRVMFLEPHSLQDKISGICHLSCSYQAKEADSVKEKTYCSFHFIWSVKRVCKTPEF